MLVTKEERVFYKTPRFADFSRGEYAQRVERVRKYMAEKGIDLLTLWDEHNVRYFCGFNSQHWDAKSLQCAVLILPLDRDPVLIIPDFFRGMAEASTYVQEKRNIWKNIWGQT